jgi:hypothetical protein
MSKMGLHDPYGWLEHKLCAKEELGVKLAIWFSTIKFLESPWLPCVQVVCNISLESSRQGLQLYFRPTAIKGIHTKLWTSKVVEVLILRIWKLPFGSLRTKWHLGVWGQNDIWVLALWPCTKYTIRGKVVASPKSGPCWVLLTRSQAPG